MVTAGAPTYLYFALGESSSRNLWLVSPVTFLIGSIYTFTIIIPEVNVILDEKVIEKKGEYMFSTLFYELFAVSLQSMFRIAWMLIYSEIVEKILY